MNTFAAMRLGFIPLLTTIRRLNVRTQLAVVGVELAVVGVDVFDEGNAAIHLANLLNQLGAFIMQGPQHILKLLAHTRHLVGWRDFGRTGLVE